MNRRALALFAALAVAVGCRGAAAPGRAAGAAREVPKGDVIWLADPAGPGEPGLERQLERLRAAALFLPAGRVDLDSGLWRLRLDPPPAHRFEKTPVVLVLRAGKALAEAFRSANALDALAVADSVGPVLAGAARARAYGRVIGVHLDFAFAPAGAQRYAQFVDALRKSVPGVFLSISVRALPKTDDERKQVEPLFASADALVAFVFGGGPPVDSVAMDAARRPWWAAFDTRSPGVLVGPNGETRADVPARFLDALTGNPRVEFENDLSLDDASVRAFRLTIRGPVRLDGVTLAAGDQVSFRLPAINEMLSQLGSSLAGRRFALGRAILFDGASEAERVFSLAAFEEILLGRSLAPVLAGSVRPAGRNAIAVELDNRSHQATVVSRVANWIEVDLSPARPAEVEVGGFDRYEVYDAGGRPVSPGHATRVRLFETLVAPMETVTPARIVARGFLPAGCCRYRLHASAASGAEITTDWSTAPPMGH